MVWKRGLSIFIFLFILISISSVSAEIMLSQPELVYNLNDVLETKIDITATKTSEGFLILKLVCHNQSEEVYKQPLTMDYGEQRTFLVDVPLKPLIINDLQGLCKLSAFYSGERKESQDFEISSNINVEVKLDYLNYNPGDEIEIRGKAIKENGFNLNGFVEIEIQGTNINSVKIIESGNINANLSIEKDIPAGSYLLNIIAYEKVNGDQINRGVVSEKIDINQLPTEIDVVITNQEVVPGNSLNFKVLLLDQTGREISGKSFIRIKNPNEEVVYIDNFDLGEEISFNTEKNISSGYWTIEAESETIKSDRLFFIKENKELETQFINNTVVIKNIGNVLFDDTIEVDISGNKKIKEIILDKGEEKEIRLFAPDGQYDIKISAGEKEFTKSGVVLTGKSISIEDVGSGGVFSQFPIAWIFILAVLGLFVFFMVMRVSKRSFFAYPIKSKKQNNLENVLEEKEEKTLGKHGGFILAESTLALKGTKSKIGVVVVNLKNKLSDEAKKLFLSIIKNQKIAVYSEEEYISLIFDPKLTKTFKNEVNAVKLGLEISNEFNNYNRKFKDKVDFGIAVGIGEIISQLDSGKLKFTQSGEVLNKTKKIAEKAEKDVLLSKDVHRKTAGEIKAEKTSEGYKIKDIVNREDHKKFIQDFLNRQKQEK